MALPQPTGQDPLIAARLQSLETLANAVVNKAQFCISCSACGFKGFDRSFTAYPEQAFPEPAELERFLVDELSSQSTQRKCPECNAMARLEGLRLLVASGTLGRDLVADRVRTSTSYTLVGPGPVVEPLPSGDPRLLQVCLDSCLRAAAFLTEMGPETLDRSESLVRGVVAAQPDTPLPRIDLAKLLLMQGRLDEGLEALQEASQRAHGNLRACLGLGNVLGEVALQRRDPQLLNIAVDWYDQALELDPENPEVHLAVGRLFMQSGNLDDAREHLVKATSSERHAVAAGYNLGLVALHQNRREESLQIFQRLAQAAPDDPDIHRALAWALAKNGRRDEALELIDQIEAAHPGDEETAQFRGLIEADEEEGADEEE